MRNMKITSSSFGFEIEVTAKVSKLKCAIYEVPISYYGRHARTGQKNWHDGWDCGVLVILRYNVFCDLNSSFTTIPALPSHTEE